MEKNRGSIACSGILLALVCCIGVFLVLTMHKTKEQVAAEQYAIKYAQNTKYQYFKAKKSVYIEEKDIYKVYLQAKENDDLSCIALIKVIPSEKSSNGFEMEAIDLCINEEEVTQSPVYQVKNN